MSCNKPTELSFSFDQLKFHVPVHTKFTLTNLKSGLKYPEPHV